MNAALQSARFDFNLGYSVRAEQLERSQTKSKVACWIKARFDFTKGRANANFMRTFISRGKGSPAASCGARLKAENSHHLPRSASPYESKGNRVHQSTTRLPTSTQAFPNGDNLDEMNRELKSLRHVWHKELLPIMSNGGLFIQSSPNASPEIQVSGTTFDRRRIASRVGHVE